MKYSNGLTVHLRLGRSHLKISRIEAPSKIISKHVLEPQNADGSTYITGPAASPVATANVKRSVELCQHPIRLHPSGLVSLFYQWMWCNCRHEEAVCPRVAASPGCQKGRILSMDSTVWVSDKVLVTEGRKTCLPPLPWAAEHVHMWKKHIQFKGFGESIP